MQNPSRRYSLILFTLLALVGQGIMDSAYASMPRTSESQALAQHAAMGMEISAQVYACHDAMPVMSDDCCGAEHHDMQACSSESDCQTDCHHCLNVIAATLIQHASWPVRPAIDPVLTDPRRDFRSIDSPRDLRPPIA